MSRDHNPIIIYLKIRFHQFLESAEDTYVTLLDMLPETKKWWFWLLNLILIMGLAYGGWWLSRTYYYLRSPAYAIKQLKEKGYHVTTDDLNKAIRKREKDEIFNLFFKANVNFRSRDSAGVHPLWAAIEADNFSLSQLLVNKGVDINIIDKTGKTALELATEKNSLPIFNLLYSAGATNTIINFNTMIRFADKGLLEKLLEKKYPLQSNDMGRWKVPHEMIMENDFLRYNIRQKDMEGMEPIHWAAARGDPEIIDLLVDKGANFDAIETKFQQTPVIVAAIAGNEAAIQRFIFFQADLNARDAEGKSALFYGIVRNHPAVVNKLLKAGADPDVRESKSGITAVSIAAYMNRISILAALIDAGADVSKEDFQGLSAMDWAAYAGNKDAIEILWDKSSAIYTENKKLTQSALRIARDSGKSNVIDYLEKISQ